MPELSSILAAVRAGHDVPDPAFDRIFPEPVRRLSEGHFTSVEVARRAARLLVPEPGASVLDVGSGPGKFCLVGALATQGTFTGIERSRSLVDVAREIAGRYRVPRVHFIHGDACSLNWTGYDGFYLFNPFSLLFGEPLGLAGRRDAEPEVRDDCVQWVQAQLAACRAGTRVVTYHGFGGDLPACYRRRHAEGSGIDVLELWVKGES